MCVGYLKKCIWKQTHTKKPPYKYSQQLWGPDVNVKMWSPYFQQKVDPLWLQREIDAESLTRLSACSRLHGPSAPSGRRQPAPTITQRLPRSC